jgi:hypothetical protein
MHPHPYSVTMHHLDRYCVTYHLPWTFVKPTTYIKLKINQEDRILKQKKHQRMNGRLLKRKKKRIDNRKYEEASENIVPVGAQSC